MDEREDKKQRDEAAKDRNINEKRERSRERQIKDRERATVTEKEAIDALEIRDKDGKKTEKRDNKGERTRKR